MILLTALQQRMLLAFGVWSGFRKESCTQGVTFQILVPTEEEAEEQLSNSIHWFNETNKQKTLNTNHLTKHCGKSTKSVLLYRLLKTLKSSLCPWTIMAVLHLKESPH